MSHLIVSSQKIPEENGCIVEVTPQSAGWTYVGFEVYALSQGQKLFKETDDQEVCMVLLSGMANVMTSEQSWKAIGKRMSIFEEIPPYSVYVPSGESIEIEALTNSEVAVCLAPGKGSYSARIITPHDVGVEIRGSGNMERRIHNILPEQKPADSLLVVEVFTPGGHWSSYPPHKHDENRLPSD
jgi:5-deoxy-glucuronate isomerase